MTICLKCLEGMKHYLDVAMIYATLYMNLNYKQAITNFKKFPESLPPFPHGKK